LPALPEMVNTRRKSVAFADAAIEEPAAPTPGRYHTRNATASPGKSLLKKPTLETDGPSKSPRKRQKTRKSADMSTEAPNVPVPRCEAVAARTLAGASPSFLEALQQVCQNIGSGDAMQGMAKVCMDELCRLGKSQVASASSKLQEREAFLNQRLSELQAADSRWDSLEQEATSSIGALDEAACAEISRELDAELPPPPQLNGQIEQMRMCAALTADQIEAAVKQVARVCSQSDALRQTICKTAHQQAFSGFLDIEEPRSLIRSLVAGL